MAILTFEYKDEAGARRFALSGAIDDRAGLDKIALLAAPVMVFDFDKVESVNSFGIKGWVQLIRQLSGSKLIYERCPVVVIESINIVSTFAKGVHIASFYLPLSCRSCDIETPKLITREKASADGFIANLNSRFTCGSCERKLEFQDDESVYFEFLGL
jgi:hypothetical protein